MHYFSNNSKLPPSLKIPQTLKLILKFISKISNYLSVYIAYKIFTTPVKFSTPKRELGMEESSQKKKLFIPSIHKNIHILSYGYSNKKILLAHGWAGRSTQLFMIANKLLEKGFMVISFDAPSHGKSLGKTTNLLEYIETINAIHQKYGPFEAAIGHSFGALAVMNSQAKNNFFKTIVTVGSGDKVSDIIFNFSYNLGFDNKFGSQLIQYFEKKNKLKIDDYATNKVAKNVKIPVLLIHDANDGDVAVSCAINIRQSLKQGKLLITNGLGHTKILRDKNVTLRIVDFIIENI